MRANVAVIGGGVSGLSAAYFLGRRGIRSVLIEKSQRLGGLIRTDRVQGCVLEAGADSFLAAKSSVAELAGELGGPELQMIESKDAARRVFIVRKGRLLAMPRGMAMMTPGDWRAALGSNLFSAKTKLRFLQEIFSRPRTREYDVSVSRFVNEHFGPEVLECVAEPLLTGVYGGDAAELSARSVLPRFVGYEERYGSLIRAVRRERRAAEHTGSLFRSFRDGMQSFTDTLAHAAAEHTTVIQAEATRVERLARGWCVFRGGECLAESDSVIVACPAYATAAILEREAASLASDLGSIPYSSAILITLVYERSQVAHPLNGFGFLTPRAERRTVAAATWVSTKFPSRVPAEFAAIRAFIVAKQADELLSAADGELVELVRADLTNLMALHARPRITAVQRWPRSMPQYVVGHAQRCERISAALRERCGLYIIGNAYEGVGVPDCVRLAKETAKRIAEQANSAPDNDGSRE